MLGSGANGGDVSVSGNDQLLIQLGGGAANDRVLRTDLVVSGTESGTNAGYLTLVLGDGAGGTLTRYIQLHSAIVS